MDMSSELLRHCKSSQRMKDFPSDGRFIIEEAHISCPIQSSAKEALSKGCYLWRMRRQAAYPPILRIHYERMVADDVQAFDPHSPPATFL